MKIEEYKIERNKQILKFIIDKIGGNVRSHKLFKVLYFAEKKHLIRYGERFFNDHYHALPFGPVPTKFYDELKKYINSSSTLSNLDFISSDMRIEGTLKEATFVLDNPTIDTDFLSEAEIECILESIDENRNINFPELTLKSHGLAWKRHEANKSRIHDLDIAEEEEADELTISFINSLQETKSAIYK